MKNTVTLFLDPVIPFVNIYLEFLILKRITIHFISRLLFDPFH